MLQYHYNWGDEDVLGLSVQVIKGRINDDNEKYDCYDSDLYTVTFKHESFEPDLFDDIDAGKYCKLLSKQSKMLISMT